MSSVARTGLLFASDFAIAMSNLGSRTIPTDEIYKTESKLMLNYQNQKDFHDESHISRILNTKDFIYFNHTRHNRTNDMPSK